MGRRFNHWTFSGLKDVAQKNAQAGVFSLAFRHWLCHTRCMMPQDSNTDPILREPPQGFSLSDVAVRLVDPTERPRFDRLMNTHHYLGFRRLAGCGLRYVALFRGVWLGLAAWQNGAFKCAPRDRWIGWKPDQQYDRLDLIANNTRFLVLSEPGVLPNFASFFLRQMTQRLSEDWFARFGRQAVLAETFCDPTQFPGTMYKASNWTHLGQTKGFSRANGTYTDPHGILKDLYVKPLRKDLKRLLARSGDLPSDVRPPPDPSRAPQDLPTLRSLYAELADIPDFRRAQGRKHTVASILTMHVFAELANMKGCIATAEFARTLTQAQLKAVGAWCNPKTGHYVPVAKSTIHRVLQSIDPEALEDVVHRWTCPRLPLAKALAADGKRIRAANRNGAGHYETVTLADHQTGAPFAMLNFHDEGGEIAATQDLLQRCDITGHVITVDALHTTRKTASLITKTADYVFTVKGNAPETFDILATIDWETEATGHFTEDWNKDHGRLEQRSIDVFTPPAGLIHYPGLQQVARITRYREPLKPILSVPNPDHSDQKDTGSSNYTETVYILTSLDADTAAPEDLLRYNRGHWSVENRNHRHRDTFFGEDACPMRTGHGPANRASLNNLALAVVLTNRRPNEGFATARRRLQNRTQDAIKALVTA